MKIKKIKPEHITNCIYCKEHGIKTQAIWHLTVRNKQACDAHKDVLEDIIEECKAYERHYTEADYQTWLRL